MKMLIRQASIFCCLLTIFGAYTAPHAQQRSYETLLYSEIEELSFSNWWGHLKTLAQAEGVYIEEHDKDYFRVYYYDEKYTPDKAFWEEFG